MAKSKKKREAVDDALNIELVIINSVQAPSKLSASRIRNEIITLSLVSITGIVGATLLYNYDIFRAFLPALVGFPAGMALFRLLGILVFATGLRNTIVGETHERLSHKTRVRQGLTSGILFALAVLISAGFIPYGLAGALITLSLLYILYMISRTKEEQELAEIGEIDSRDLPSSSDPYADTATPEPKRLTMMQRLRGRE